jgi:hypothetical protein
VFHTRSRREIENYWWRVNSDSGMELLWQWLPHWRFTRRGLVPTTLQYDAIQKQIRKVWVAFDIKQDASQIPVVPKWIPCHHVADAQYENGHHSRY